MSSDLNNFESEKECIFEDERYSVRDNGSVLRHAPTGKRTRPSDNQWTFGKINTANKYLHIASVRVHRIVATAFHGDPPDPKYVVDHIDTNRCNNRPENLRWLTRLENALSNAVTRKKLFIYVEVSKSFLKILQFCRVKLLSLTMLGCEQLQKQKLKTAKRVWINGPLRIKSPKAVH